MRHPIPPPIPPTAVWPDFSPPVPQSKGAYSVKVIGRAMSKEILDDALAGWENHVDRPDGLQWVHDRLMEASSSPSPDIDG